MSACFEIQSSTGGYPVTIGAGVLQEVIDQGGERLWLVDDFFGSTSWIMGQDHLTIHADEKAKSLDKMTDIIVALRERRATRKTTLVAVGGGIIQDIAAFSASVYMRGVPWIYVPTTVLSMADSCIGGKSSINVGKFKNIVGTIHPPAAVVVDPSLAMSLSAEQKASGLCEVAKICLCRGVDTYERYIALDPSPDASVETMAQFITLSLQAKKWFIEIDEFDQSERLLLNFGHTFGHALEAASNFEVTHGIAVGLGMLAALHLGEEMGRDYLAAPHIGHFRRHIASLVGVVDGLPTILSAIDAEMLLDAFRSDKKHSRDDFAVIIVDGSGQVERRLLARHADTEAMIARAFRNMLKDWSPTK